MWQAQGCLQCHGKQVIFECSWGGMVRHLPFRQKDADLQRNTLTKKMGEKRKCIVIESAQYKVKIFILHYSI